MNSSFIDAIKKTQHISFDSMRDLAIKELKSINSLRQDVIYEDLQRGKGILDDDEHLNMYLRSYGKMHKAKLEEAFKYFPSDMDFENTVFEIYDWGCGQGTASICLLDYFEKKQIKPEIDRKSVV